LLDALEALETHREAVIVAGAQAVYLRTGAVSIGIAPFTTDGDLAIDPSVLGDAPLLADAMRGADFIEWEAQPGTAEPGIWEKRVTIDGTELLVPVDLIVPAGVAGAGRRGAPLGPHGRRAARRATGLEVALFDHSPMAIDSMQPSDPRRFEVNVAGEAALLVAKAHKLHDRAASPRPDRLDDKDAADVFRLMQTTSPDEVGRRLAELRAQAVAEPVIDAASTYLAELFSPQGDGTRLAVRALRLAVPEARVTAIIAAYVEALGRESAA
jgi:hypothetical protein